MKDKLLITGACGFIGYHLCKSLLDDEYEVLGIDNINNYYDTKLKLDRLNQLKRYENFKYEKIDIMDRNSLSKSFESFKPQKVVNLAAQAGVRYSIENPYAYMDSNLVGFLNVIELCRHNNVEGFIYASSSSVYGDDSQLPKVESRVGNPLSPYAASKSSFEDYASVFYGIHGIETIGLRYFNVFGPRQSPNGAYAAVIPKFVHSIQRGESPIIFGDGEQTRDFTFVRNVVDANLLALFGENESSFGQCFNVACGDTISINKLFQDIKNSYEVLMNSEVSILPEYSNERAGDVRDSLADLEKIRSILGYSPRVSYLEGIRETVAWFISGDT